MFKHISRIVSVICCFALTLSISGVYALWYYTQDKVDPVSKEIIIKLNQFNWAGSGELPEDSLAGEDHISLIDNIINHPEHGLNKSGSYLNDEIADRKKGGWGWKRDTLGSMAVTQSEELSEIFGLAASKLNFLIQFKSDTEYYIFTTGVYLGERGEVNILGNNKKPGNPTTPIGENIYPIFRTRVVKTNGVWAAVETEVGYAKSAWYEESRSNANATQIPSFDPDTFQVGKLALFRMEKGS
jgi:hypothetical protein